MSKKFFFQILRDKESMTYLSLIIMLSVISLFFLVNSSLLIRGASETNSSTYNLTAWDETDARGGSLTKYTNGTIWSKTESDWNVFFYANYTNLSSNATFFGSDVNCSVRFDENITGTFTSWLNMSYNSSADRYQYNRSFSYKGEILFEVNCTNLTAGKLNVSDNVAISNTRPKITGKNEITGWLPAQTVTEDTVWNYNVTLNASVLDDDFNDVLAYSYTASGTNLTNFTLSSNGILTINVTTNQTVSVNGSSTRQIALVATDNELGSDTAKLNITHTAVNDKPLITNCSGSVCTIIRNNTNAVENQQFTMQLNASDEETNTPYLFNITFTSCLLANWSIRGTNCTLFDVNNRDIFNKTNGTFSFMPANNDVGNYTMAINVTDAGVTNASNMTIINLTVINLNNAPNMTWNCTDSLGSSLWNATENTTFSCFVNATDIDEIWNITFITNSSWFIFNNSINSTTINDTDPAAANSTFMANISFTANNSMVGLWYFNITAVDSQGAKSSVVINFNISNINDTVGLERIPTKVVYTAVELYFEVNASDNDLLIPPQGKLAGFNHSDLPLNFTINITLNGGNVTEGGNLSLFTLKLSSQTGNRTIRYAQFTPDYTDAGNYTVNITVNDYNRSYASQTFNLNITQNTAPYWTVFDNSTKTLTEGTQFLLNLFSNATDDDGDRINFSTNSSATDFYSFSMNLSGNIDFTPVDQDVGSHLLYINITDAKGAVNTTTINFTVRNINDTPTLAAVNATAMAREDELFTLWILASDSDFYIPSRWQLVFFNETLNFTVNISITNASGSSNLTEGLLNFSKYNNTAAIINFTPTKAFGGNYSINVTVNDSTGLMASKTFTLNVTLINHAPDLAAIWNQNATVNNVFVYDINATDTEDGADNGTGSSNLTFSITIINSTNSNRANVTNYILNNSWVNITLGTGRIRLNINTNNTAGNITNVTFISNSTFVGVHWLNVTVNDTENYQDSALFKLTVFSANVAPSLSSTTISNPTSNSTLGTYVIYKTPENCTGGDCQTFTVFISDDNSAFPNYDNFTIRWYVNSALNKTATDVRNDSATTYTFYSNFTDEGIKNITVIASDPYNQNATFNWTINVTHSNAPVVYSGPIPNSTGHTGTGTATFTLDMGTYFSDIDHSHTKYNQSINFTFKQMDVNYAILNTTTIDLSINNNSLVATFSTSATAEELFEITAYDSINSSIWLKHSNNFTVNFTVTAAQTVTVAVADTGGGGGARIPYAFKLIAPEPVTMYTQQQIIVPIKIQNKGTASFTNIKLAAFSTLEGMKITLSKNKIPTLDAGKTENIDMIIYVEKGQTGSYEVILNASSESPVYTDTASFFVDLLEIGWEEKVKAQEKVVFLEELLLGNPECLELTEVMKEAKKTLENKDYKKALQLAEDAIQACKYAVASKGKVVQVVKKYKFEQFSLLVAEILFILIVPLIIYYFTRMRFKKKKLAAVRI